MDALRSCYGALLIALTLGSCVSSLSSAEPPVPAAKIGSKRIPFTISKQTTYITESIRADGFPDYVAALDNRGRRGVTPSNNASVLLWQAAGPEQIPAEHRAEYFRRLGIEMPPLQGNYVLTVFDFARQLTDPVLAERFQKEIEAADSPIFRAERKPWTKKELPILASWTVANERGLELATQAGRRVKHYDSIWGDDLLETVNISLPVIQRNRTLAQALVTRAMLRTGESEFDAAIDDLLACEHLASLTTRGDTALDNLLGFAFASFAFDCEIALLDTGKLNHARLARLSKELAALPDFGTNNHEVLEAERLWTLDMVCMIVRDGLKGLQRVTSLAGSDEEQQDLQKVVDWIGRNLIDWNQCLAFANNWFDKLDPIYSMLPGPARDKAISAKEDELSAVRKRLSNRLAVEIVAHPSQAATEWLKYALVAYGSPTHSHYLRMEQQAILRRQLALSGVGLAAYRLQNGRFPQRLEELRPGYVAEIPEDLFTGMALRYSSDGKSCVLYSVGMNRTDDGGLYHIANEKDDIVIRLGNEQKSNSE